MQVDTAKAIEDRLSELADEMVKSESKTVLEKAINEGIEQVQFESAMSPVNEDLVENAIANELRTIAMSCIEREQTMESVD